ncbi:MAG: peptide-methionine (R)-S-oxide reductase [Pirellulales bacterium]
MIRLGLIAVALGLMSFLYPAADETVKSSSDKTATAQSEGKSADGKSTDGKKVEGKKRLTHEEQIAAMFKDHPFIDNPKGVLRKSKDFNQLKGCPAQVINNKHTERAFTGELWNHKGEGTYVCKKCNCPLYRSNSKFESHCGWPTDDEIVGT